MSRSPHRRSRSLPGPLKALAVFLLTLIVAVSAFYLWPQRFLLPKFFGTAVFCVETPEKLVALTFDDGPDPQYTPAIANLLKRHQAKATFFVLGRRGQEHLAILRDLMAAGHELGNHTFNHPNLNFTLPPTIQTEIGETDAVLKQVQYPDPVYFRPPYGRAGLTVTSTVKPLGRVLILWDIDLMDWTSSLPPVATMAANLKQQLKPGAIILLHDAIAGADSRDPRSDRQPTVDLVENILTTYGTQGYRFVTVSELLKAGEALPSLKQCQRRPTA
ncbi:MAG: polysaccharide deacetylase family protein [Nodosilinea sp.]